jgi:hypothetical protein
MDQCDRRVWLHPAPRPRQELSLFTSRRRSAPASEVSVRAGDRITCPDRSWGSHARATARAVNEKPQPDAVIADERGWLHVDYSKIDAPFMTLVDWRKFNGAPTIHGICARRTRVAAHSRAQPVNGQFRDSALPAAKIVRSTPPNPLPFPQDKLVRAADWDEWARCRTCGGQRWSSIFMNSSNWFACSQCIPKFQWPAI